MVATLLYLNQRMWKTPTTLGCTPTQATAGEVVLEWNLYRGGWHEGDGEPG